MDCLEAMKQMPDKAFDLAVVDPPYGDASDTHTHSAARAGTELPTAGRNVGICQVADGGTGSARGSTGTRIRYVNRGVAR